MKFSTRTKYGLSAMILLAEYYEADSLKSLVSLAEELEISKIYLEQVFSQLKKHDLVVSIKGAKGGYKLAHHAKDITILAILEATEPSLFELEELPTNDVTQLAAYEAVYRPFQEHILAFFSDITLFALKEQFNQLNFNESFMYYL